MLYTLLAHGALGVWDEMIFLAVVVVFVGLMGMSWFQNRHTPPDFDDNPELADPTHLAVPGAPKPKNDDRFELDQ